MDALDRLAAINAAQAKARLEHPDVVAFIDHFKSEFPNGAAHFYPKGRAFLEPKGITADRMFLRSFEKPKKKDKRRLNETFLK